MGQIPAVQMLHTLYNKGSQFCGILSHNPADVQAGPLIEQLLADTIGPDWILTSFIAIITSRGNIPQNLHQDQAIAPHQSMEGPFSCNTMYAIDDFTADNGGTLVIPGSHLIASKSLRITEPLPPAINLHCPAGTGIVFEGRLLHGTGVNRTHKTRAMIVADARKPFMRQQELHFASVARDVLESAPPKLLYRLGFLPSRILGGVEGDWYGDSYLVGQRLLLESGKFEPVRQLGPESSDEELKKDYNFRHSQLGVRMVKYQGEATDKVKEKFRDTKPAWKAPPKAMF